MASPRSAVTVTSSAAGRPRPRLRAVRPLLEALGRPRRPGDRPRRLFRRPEGRGGGCCCCRLRVVQGRDKRQCRQRGIRRFTARRALLQQPGIYQMILNR